MRPRETEVADPGASGWCNSPQLSASARRGAFHVESTQESTALRGGVLWWATAWVSARSPRTACCLVRRLSLGHEPPLFLCGLCVHAPDLVR